MEEIVKLDSVSVYNNLRGVETLHPLVSVVDLSEAQPMSPKTFNFGVYAVYLKELKCGEMRYGRSQYDFQDGTMVFIAPGQIMGVQPNVASIEPKGWALLFHPDFIRGTQLGRDIINYSFFSYASNEALHLSEKERQIVIERFANIRYEMEQGIDNHSKNLIVSNLELLLRYCKRFYDRQFITRDNSNKGILERFEQLLNDYFLSEKPLKVGLPSVAYFAEELNLSANYFGDLIKRDTGKSAQDYIQSKVIDLAKDRVYDFDKTISEIAYGLGFKYPQHFTRLFKQKVGVSPNEYRNLN